MSAKFGNLLVAGGEPSMVTPEVGLHYVAGRYEAAGWAVHTLNLNRAPNHRGIDNPPPTEEHLGNLALSYSGLVVVNPGTFGIDDGRTISHYVSVAAMEALDHAHQAGIASLMVSHEIPAVLGGPTKDLLDLDVIALHGEVPTLEMIQASREDT